MEPDRSSRIAIKNANQGHFAVSAPNSPPPGTQILGTFASLLGLLGIFLYFTGWIYRWAYFGWFSLEINRLDLPLRSFLPFCADTGLLWRFRGVAANVSGSGCRCLCDSIYPLDFVSPAILCNCQSISTEISSKISVPKFISPGNSRISPKRFDRCYLAINYPFLVSPNSGIDRCPSRCS